MSMTQEQLSFASGVSRQYISYLEHDKKSPTVETLLRLCDAMRVSASDMIRRVERARRAGKR
jgi:transcriptional regulator with XRE-family HTH domain